MSASAGSYISRENGVNEYKSYLERMGLMSISTYVSRENGVNEVRLALFQWRSQSLDLLLSVIR